jgi:hypothetical protein
MRLDSEGEIIWKNRIGGETYDLANSVVITDQSIFVAARTNSFGFTGETYPPLRGWLLELSYDGEMESQTIFGEQNAPDNHIGFERVVLLQSGDLLLAGYYTESGGGYEGTPVALAIRVNQDSNIEWQESISSANSIWTAQQVEKGELFLAGDEMVSLIRTDGLVEGVCSYIEPTSFIEKTSTDAVSTDLTANSQSINVPMEEAELTIEEATEELTLICPE